MKLSRLVELLQRTQEFTSYDPNVVVLIGGDGNIQNIYLNVNHNYVVISTSEEKGENKDVQSNS